VRHCATSVAAEREFFSSKAPICRVGVTQSEGIDPSRRSPTDGLTRYLGIGGWEIELARFTLTMRLLKPLTEDSSTTADPLEANKRLNEANYGLPIRTGRWAPRASLVIDSMTAPMPTGELTKHGVHRTVTHPRTVPAPGRVNLLHVVYVVAFPSSRIAISPGSVRSLVLLNCWSGHNIVRDMWYEIRPVGIFRQ
jgi:hypothetical protein